ncbi:polysaccharide biosynthesis protein [Candidatus Methylopumilus planktonicus]|uniref:polysaccharide biosynthesis protein n=1 Tax=Candidatus Methylopumilus planktonicus TaxID=1581557 RepID=UPI0011220D95|nr:nucleoside-diphosphate sugar epimerase/dehydratase [Candidatus Methylopumilus planktonicus]QDD01764.1 polysaccharide biosynthesis protein [Candidatus Methylopumilus planktonicus]
MQKNNIFSMKRILAMSHDFGASILAWGLAYQLRFNFVIPLEHLDVMKESLIWVVLVQILSFSLMGLYKGIWRFASVIDLQRIIFSVLLSSLILGASSFMLKLPFVVPRSVLVIDLAILILIMGGSRFIYRAIKEHQIYGLRSLQGEPVVIVGTDQTAVSLAKELLLSNDWRVVGIITEDVSLHGREISGIKVLGSIFDLSKIQSRFDLSKLIIAHPLLNHQDRRFILSQAETLGIDVLTTPTIDDLMSGRLSVSQIRPVDVEDLLGRDSVKLNNSGLTALIKNEVVLVTGAGGSIGSELCRQIVKFKPKHLICFDISEYALYQLEQIFIADQIGSNIYVVGDVKNKDRLNKIFERYQPKLVFHAAAYKHVPLMENHNVAEALQNNVLGTLTIANVSKSHGVVRFVLISTDKAVNPTNVMGASKRLAEMVCQGLQAESGTRFVMVRFGNVLGSSGSVIPKFRQQIASGGPVTVTHPEITRYFMSIPEAAQLVMQAGLMGNGGEVFVLDMGDPVRIVDLAKDMIKLSGFDIDDIKIKFTGLRPGEKLYEELLADDEHTLPTPHEKLRIASVKPVNEEWVKALQEWINSSTNQEEQKLKESLKFWVEEYQGNSNVR